MKVSIITPTYNSAETICINLLSVSSQTYGNIEHIIVDNCSKDATLNRIAEFKHDIVVISEPDKGIYDAMNKGIGKATGDIIGILNSDDYLATEHTIAEVVAAFEENSCDGTYGDLLYVNRKNTSKITRVWIAGHCKENKLFTGWMPPHPTIFLKREVYKNCGLFKCNLKYAADYDMILRLLLTHKIRLHYIEKIIVYMRSGGCSNKNWFRRISVNREDVKAWDSVSEHIRWYTRYLKPGRKLVQYLIKYCKIKWLFHVPPTDVKNSYINK